MRVIRTGLLAAMAVALVCASGGASAEGGPNPYLGQAKVYYQGLEFEKCIARLEQATKWKSSSLPERTEIELYAGLCNYNIGNADLAEKRFRAAIELNANAALPPYTSPKIQQLFQTLKEEAAPKKTELAATVLKKDAPTKTDLAPPNDAGPPPAMADVQSEAHATRSLVVPLALGGAGVAAGALGAVLGIQAKSLEQQSHDAHFESDAIALGRDAQQRATLANVGFAVAGAAITGAIVTYVLTGPAEAQPAR